MIVKNTKTAASSVWAFRPTEMSGSMTKRGLSVVCIGSVKRGVCGKSCLSLVLLMERQYFHLLVCFFGGAGWFGLTERDATTRLTRGEAFHIRVYYRRDAIYFRMRNIWMY